MRRNNITRAAYERQTAAWLSLYLVGLLGLAAVLWFR